MLRPLAELVPRWYWDFCVLFGLLFSVFIAVVGGPLFAVFPILGVSLAALFSWIRRQHPAQRAPVSRGVQSGSMPAWPRSRKVLFGAVALLPIVLFALAMVLDAALTEQGERSAPPEVLVPAGLAALLWFAGVIWGIVHVAKRDDLSGDQRTRSLLGLFLFAPIVLPLLWTRLIRPLPEPSG